MSPRSKRTEHTAVPGPPPPASPSIHPGPSELTYTSVTLVVSGYPAYAAAKAGIQGMSRNLALDYAASKIRVNVVSPGAVDTNMSGNSRKQACKACNTFVVLV